MDGKSSSQHAGKVIRCRAAICRNPGQSLVIEEVGSRASSSMGGSDQDPLHLPLMSLSGKWIPLVESVGEEVEDVEEGDMVVPLFPGECGECRSSKSNVCTKFGAGKLGGMEAAGSGTWKEELFTILLECRASLNTRLWTSLMSSRLALSFHPKMPTYLLACGVSTEIGAVWKVAGVEEGSTVAIFGLGAVGLAVAEGARLRRASKIIGVDLNPRKF